MTKQTTRLIIITICLTIYTAFIFWSDYSYGITAHPVAYLGIILVGTAIVSPGLRITKTRKISIAMLAIFIGLMISLNFVSLSPIKQFKQFFYKINPGMSREELQNLMQTHFKNSTYHLACFPLSIAPITDSEEDNMSCSLSPGNTLSGQAIEVYYQDRRVVTAIIKKER
jgi:hypothetical protein